MLFPPCLSLLLLVAIVSSQYPLRQRWGHSTFTHEKRLISTEQCWSLEGNLANPAHPPKSDQYHFYRKEQQGAVFFCHMNVKSFKLHRPTKEDCSLLFLLTSILWVGLPAYFSNHSPFSREHIFVGINEFPSLECWCIVIHHHRPQRPTLFSKSEMGFNLCAM